MPIKGLKGGIGSKALGYGLGAAEAAEETDAEFNQTVLLLHGDGTNGEQNNTFVDSSTNNHTITRNGDTTQGTFSPFSLEDGYWSNHFPGSAEVESASSTTFNITDYVTLECWIYFDSLGSDVIVGREANYWLAYNNTGIGGTANKFVFTINNGSWTQAVSSSTTPVVGQWYHILGVKDGTTLRFYLDGTQENTSTFTGSPTNSGYAFSIGSYRGLESMNGYLSNVRLVTGASNAIFPYSGLTSGSSFSVPTTPLTAVSGTQILTCQSNRLVDNSTNGHSILIGAGTPKVQPFSPIAPSRSYSKDAVGGSAYFDGTGDYLESIDFLGLSNSDFTIGAWVYYSGTTFNAYNEIICNGVAASGGEPASFTIHVTSTGSVRYYLSSNGTSWDIASNKVMGSINKNEWAFIELDRNGTTFTPYVNGVAGTTTTSSSSLNNTDAPLTISGIETHTRLWTGYIAEPFIIKGARRTGVGTVPTAPMALDSDAFFYSKFTNAGIIDHTMKNNLETEGNAQIDTSVKQFGTGSLKFDGTGDGLIIPFNNHFTFNTGDFTIEYWFRGTSANMSILHPSTTGAGYWSNFITSATLFRWQSANQTTNKKGVSATPIIDGNWHHIAIVRSSGILNYYFDGTVAGSPTTDTTDYSGSSGTLRIGTSGSYVPDLNGNIDELRITKGVARYTSNFTAPTQAFANR